eukprot:TRINITY_DN3686_c0_g1_i2.p4 TRINITY_DN3686_c0_g1~~TRINITY_DN3686_c0_g1_i2.p4  ORF type:complete len:120 (+),score=38.29 TRINITY_DN3686_c0_g1_i2:106-465(+)
MIRRPPRSTHCISSAASDVYKRQVSTQSTWEGEQVGDLWIVYHAWLWDKIQQNPGRVMLIDQVLWTNDNWPTFSNGGYPSDTPQTAPFQSTLPNQSKFTTTNKKADQYQSNIVKTLRKQ